MIKDANNNHVFKVKMRAKSFALDPLEEEQAAFSATKVNAEIWHKRLGYFNHKAVINLQRNELAQGLSCLASKISNCRACQQGKQIRLPFKQSTWRAIKKPQLVYIDVTRPRKTPSINGSRYYLIFIDDIPECAGYIILNTSQKWLVCSTNSKNG